MQVGTGTTTTNSVTDDLHSSICLAACRIVAAVGDNGTVVIRGDSDEE